MSADDEILDGQNIVERPPPDVAYQLLSASSDARIGRRLK
jgi:hypothetical protein